VTSSPPSVDICRIFDCAAHLWRELEIAAAAAAVVAADIRTNQLQVSGTLKLFE